MMYELAFLKGKDSWGAISDDLDLLRARMLMNPRLPQFIIRVKDHKVLVRNYYIKRNKEGIPIVTIPET